MLVILIDVVALELRQQTRIDQITIIRDVGQIDPAKVSFVLRVLLSHQHVLDTDAKLLFFVKTRSTRDQRPSFELLSVCSFNTLEAELIRVRKASNAVLGAMLVMKASFPQSLSCEDFHVLASDSRIIGPNCLFEVNQSHNTPCVGFSHLSGSLLFASPLSASHITHCLLLAFSLEIIEHQSLVFPLKVGGFVAELARILTKSHDRGVFKLTVEDLFGKIL